MLSDAESEFALVYQSFETTNGTRELPMLDYAIDESNENGSEDGSHAPRICNWSDVSDEPASPEPDPAAFETTIPDLDEEQTAKYKILLADGRMPLRDREDHIYRCTDCLWEVEDGQCVECGKLYNGVPKVDAYEGPNPDTIPELAEYAGWDKHKQFDLRLRVELIKQRIPACSVEDIIAALEENSMDLGMTLLYIRKEISSQVIDLTKDPSSLPALAPVDPEIVPETKAEMMDSDMAEQREAEEFYDEVADQATVHRLEEELQAVKQRMKDTGAKRGAKASGRDLQE